MSVDDKHEEISEDAEQDAARDISSIPKKAEDLADLLAHDLPAKTRFVHPYARAIPFFALSLLYLGVVLGLSGLRPDLFEKLGNVFFWAEMAAAFVMFVGGGLASAWVGMPDLHNQKWVLAVPLCGVLALVVLSAARAMQEGVYLLSPHWDHCFEGGMIMGALPAAIVALTMWRLNTVHPLLAALVNVIAVTGAAYIGLRLTCMMDTVGHSFIYHVAPFVVMGALVGVFARRLYRW